VEGLRLSCPAKLIFRARSCGAQDTPPALALPKGNRTALGVRREQWTKNCTGPSRFERRRARENGDSARTCVRPLRALDLRRAIKHNRRIGGDDSPRTARAISFREDDAPRYGRQRPILRLRLRAAKNESFFTRGFLADGRKSYDAFTAFAEFADR